MAEKKSVPADTISQIEKSIPTLEQYGLHRAAEYLTNFVNDSLPQDMLHLQIYLSNPLDFESHVSEVLFRRRDSASAPFHTQVVGCEWSIKSVSAVMFLVPRLAGACVPRNSTRI